MKRSFLIVKGFEFFPIKIDHCLENVIDTNENDKIL